MPSKFMRSLPEKAKRLLRIMIDNKPCDDDDLEEDGGPGSGNWGHHGRPGHVGGSGKGGGKQYRGGRGDIMYTSSKRDWLNGLKGERQHEAQSFMKKMREHYNQPEEQNKSVEQLIMEEPRTKYGGNSAREKMLSYMAEARSWDETAGRLIEENWDENDKKLAQALAAKYGVSFVGGVALPDDSSDTDQWDDEELRTWQDLKSKAMGGPTSGREAPDELQYAAGLKERPAPPPAPKWPEPYMNNQWFDDLPEADRQHLNDILSQMHISSRGFFSSDINGAERNILYNISRGDKNSIWEGRRYFSAKDDITGKQFMAAVQAAGNPDNPGKIGNLDDKESIILSAFMDDLIKEDNARNGLNNTISQVGDILEADFLNDQTVTKAAKAAYMTLKAAAMGTSLIQSEITDAGKALQKYRVERNEQRKIAEALKTKEGRAAAYNPPSVAGVARRQQGNMSFDEADNNHANPDYLVNRNYRENCQTCVVAHEMRLRGYDVEAKPRNGDAESMQHRIAAAHGVSAAWLDMDTGKPVIAQTASQNGATTKKGVIKWFERTIKPGERYHMSFCWKGARAAHIVTLQRDDSGSLMIYDPQTNKMNKDLDGYLSNVTFTASSSGRWPLQIVRVDNAIPVQNVVNTVLKPARQY